MANGFPEGAGPRAIFRVAALDGALDTGDMDVASSSGGGTLIEAKIPAALEPAPDRPGAMGNEGYGKCRKYRYKEAKNWRR